MPLSEHEQRILAELEESLARHDPHFAERVRNKGSSAHSGRHSVWAALCFVTGLAVLMVFYSRSVVLGLAGVAIMFGSAVVFERNVRQLGKDRWMNFTRLRSSEEHQPDADHVTHGTTRDWIRSRLFRRDS